MNRAAFCAALRAGLAGMPGPAVDDIVSDYETHFSEGLAAGRSEEQIAAALGDPHRLARELRVEHGLQRWEAKRSPGSAVAAVFALIGLGAIDIIVLLPLLIAAIGILVGSYFWSLFILVGGVGAMAIGPVAALPGGPFAAILFGLGLVATAIFGMAVLTIICIGLVNGIVWFARLHYRALKLADQSG